MFSKDYHYEFKDVDVDYNVEYVYRYREKFTDPDLLKYHDPDPKLLFEIVLRIIDSDNVKYWDKFRRKIFWDDLDFDAFLVIAKRIKSCEMIDAIKKQLKKDGASLEYESWISLELFEPILEKKNIPSKFFDCEFLRSRGEEFIILEIMYVMEKSCEEIEKYIKEKLIYEDSVEGLWDQVVEIAEAYNRLDSLDIFASDIYDDYKYLGILELLPVYLMDICYKPPDGKGWLEEIEKLKLEQEKFDSYLNRVQ